MSRWVFVAMCSGVAIGCEPAPAGSTTESNDASTTDDPTGEPVVGWFELGYGDTMFSPLADGDTLQIVWGGQGAAMFPLPLRGAEFVLPDPPTDYNSPLAPIFELELDIEGYNDGPGGHFKRVANYPITFEVTDDGTYEYIYVAVLLPDAIDPEVLDGLPAHLSARLKPHDAATFDVELDLVVASPGSQK